MQDTKRRRYISVLLLVVQCDILVQWLRIDSNVQQLGRDNASDGCPRPCQPGKCKQSELISYTHLHLIRILMADTPFAQELFGNTLRPKRKLRTAVAFVLGGMSVAIRFTSLAAFIPVGILLADQETDQLYRE